VAGEGISKD